MLLTSTIPNNFSDSFKNHFRALEVINEEKQLTGGLGFTVILKDNGTVWTFGLNDKYQLGLSDTIDRFTPTRIDPALFNNEKVVEVQANAVSVIAKTETNKIYYWGNGTSRPILIYNNLRILDFDGIGYTGVDNLNTLQLVTEDGYVHSSGSNVRGAFGIGTNGWRSARGTCTSSTGVSVTDFSTVVLKDFVLEPCPNNSSWRRIVDGSSVLLSDVIEIATSENSFSTLVRTSTNELYIWGNSYGYKPRKLPDSTNYDIKKIEMSDHPFFITTSGKLYFYPDINNSPVEISLENTTSRIKDISGPHNSLIILTDEGKVYGLGSNTFGNLGPSIPTTGVNYSSRLALFTGIENVKKIGTGYDHSIVMYNDDRFATFGRNSYGELSTIDVNSKTTFVKNNNLSNVTDIVAMNYSSFASTSDNNFYSWGGRTGSENLNRPGADNTPMLVKDFSTISPIREINGFTSRTIDGGVFLENGEFWTYGDNWKIGTGHNGGGHILKALTNTNSALNGRDFTLKDGSQGSTHGLGISIDNKLYTWGYDGNSLLGLGYNIESLESGVMTRQGAYAFQEPITPLGVTFEKVYAGYQENLILTPEGNVFAWGSSENNKLGLNFNPTTPTLVTSLPPIKDIAMGLNHNLFLDFDGNVWAAGANGYGQLGIGNTTSPNLPTKIPSLSNVKSIGAGENSSFAILDSGELYAWGDNRNSQLGLGDTIQRNEPRLVPGISNAKKAEGGLKHTLVITDLGELFVAGSDSNGQLGLSQEQYNPDPIIVVFPPLISIFTPDNQELTVDDDFQVVGEVFSETQNVPMKLEYEIESSSGKIVSLIKNYTTSSIPEPFSITIPLSTYNLGSYTLIIKATTDSGVTGQSAINFSVQDKTKPTISVDKPTIPKWSISPVIVNITADDAGGSGYRGFRYAVTQSSSLPTSWSSFNSNKIGRVTIDKSGEIYLHLEAYDNIGNITYLKAGPYYIDLVAPDITFTEPPKWQQDKLNLGVDVNDVSNIAIKKWMQGTYTMDEVKLSGNLFTGNSIPITTNGIYSFYAIDENNQETLEYFNVSNINYQPILYGFPNSLIVPSISKSNYTVSTVYSHLDDADPTFLEMDFSGNKIKSLNSYNVPINNQSKVWNFNVSSLTENNLYSGNLYLKDSRNGFSTKENVQLEVYNPNLKLTSKVDGMKISWLHSSISQNYRVLKDGEVIYTGTSNNCFDPTSPNTNHHYSLEVFNNGSYIEVASINKNTGYNLFETPSAINFPAATIGPNTSLLPSSMDIEYVKYDDFSDEITPYSLKVSIGNFSSAQSSFTADSFVMKNIKKLDRTNSVSKTYSDIYVVSTPKELISPSETISNPYTKLELLKENILLSLPSDIKLNSGSSENFNANLVWEISFTP